MPIISAWIEKLACERGTEGVRVNNMHTRILMVAICPKKGYNFRVSSVHFLLPSWWTGGGGSLITGNVTHAITDSLFTVFESDYPGAFSKANTYCQDYIIDTITITITTVTMTCHCLCLWFWYCHLRSQLTLKLWSPQKLLLGDNIFTFCNV